MGLEPLIDTSGPARIRGSAAKAEVVRELGAKDYLITVAICTRNRASLMEQSVSSVLRQMRDRAELLVVDNASTDNTGELACKLAAGDSGMRVSREDRLGLSYARNAALAQAKGDYVIFLDDDATAEDGWLDAYYDFFAKPPCSGLACVGGAVLPRYAQPPPVWLAPGVNALDCGNAPHPILDKGGPWGCNVAYHRQTVRQLGGFCVTLGRRGGSLGSYEETDLYLRILAAGFKAWWLPAARIQHFYPPHRLRLKYLCKTEFEQGRSTAIFRLRRMPNLGQRAGFRSIRVATAPFHAGVCLLAALVTFPLRHGQTAARLLLKSARIAGIACQSILGRPAE
jgi:GT2 family glycosyltransferase